MQAPCAAIRTTVLRNIQKVINQLVFGKFFQIRTDTAQQPYKDGGVSHLHVERRMKAEWAMLAAQLANNEPAPWKNIWWYGMRTVYGPLCDDRDLVHTTCQFKLLQSSKEPSQVQQLAIAAWAELEKVPVFLGPPPTTPAGRKRRADALALAQYDGDESPPVTMPIWQEGLRGDTTGATVGRQRLWFNASLVGCSGSHIHTPSHTHDAATIEREAIRWAEEGLLRYADVTQGKKLQGIRSFKNQVPALDPDVYLGIRASIPPQWERAMQDGTSTQWGQDRLPTNLLDDGARADTAATCQQQHIGIRYTATLIQRPVTPLLNLRLKHVYTAMTAAAFTMPRVVDAAQGLAARHSHLFEHIPVAHRTGAIARAVRRIKHPAIPPEFTETAFCVAFSGFPFGPEKGTMCGRLTCPCNSGAPETVGHTFHTCYRSMRLWEYVLSSWRDVTGESKIKPTDGLVVLFGDRSGTWLDEAEQAQFAGLEEPFAVLHKITLHTILQERNREAAPTPPF